MKAVISVVGKDKVGIIAGVSKVLAEKDINIVDISQTTMQDMFTMIMLVALPKENMNFSEIAQVLDNTGKEMGLEIRIQRDDVFTAMHRI